MIQLEAALRARLGEPAVRSVFLRAGHPNLLRTAPAEMVDELTARELFDATCELLPAGVASEVLADAGRRTAEYLLENRIPRPAQALLKALPPFVSGRLLLAAIRRNAWTFAGSGVFSARAGRPSVIEIAGNPLAVPGCVWHVAVIERLFRALVAPQTDVGHPRCCRAGEPACRFEIRCGARA